MALTVAVAALGAALAGCGGSSSGGGSGAALSRSQLVAKANAICSAEQSAGEKIEPPAHLEDAEQAATYFDQVDPLVSSTTDKLAALKPDSEVAADWNAYLSVRKQFATLMHTVRQKADSKDRTGLQDLQGAQPLTDQMGTTAKKVGADACATG